MKTYYEVIGSNQIKIIEEEIITKEQIVDFSAVQKRVDELNNQISTLTEELNRWENMLKATKNKVVKEEIPSTIDEIKE